VLRLARAEGLLNVPLCRHGSGRAVILCSDGAARSENAHSDAIQDRSFFHTSHYCLLEAGLGADPCGLPGAAAGAAFWATSFTRTSWPSSSESAGLTTIQSES